MPLRPTSRLRALPVLAGLTVACLATSLMVRAAPAAAVPGPDGGPAVPRPAQSQVERPARDGLIGRGWQSSVDIAWTTSGDAGGFHILAARAADGYAWRTVATLSEPGFDVDQWIGQACVSGSGRRLAVVYAPRTFTNDEDLFGRGAFTATVDLVSGQVRKLPVLSTLAYHSPGCGTGETAVVTQQRDDKRALTRIVTLDLVRGTQAEHRVANGQFTSAVPVAGGVAVAALNQIVRVGPDGRTTQLTTTAGVGYGLAPDANGGVVFMEYAGDRARVRQTVPGKPSATRMLAEGKVTDLGVSPASGGLVYITGKASRVHALPGGVSKIDAPAGAEVSTRGELVLSRVGYAGDPRQLVSDPSVPRAVDITARSLKTGKGIEFGVSGAPSPGGQPAAGRAAHPTLGTAAAVTAPADPTDPVSDEAYCSVPRNDPRSQALQPRPRQVEWAVDQAITGTPYAARPANWMNLGMEAYSPLGLFPRIPLLGGSNARVPAQIYLGIVAQESNMWQAARFAVPGVTANPLIGNYYGVNVYNDTESDDWAIRWDDSDCGYGVGQVTDGMRKAGHEKDGEVALEPRLQRAIALDFAANIAAGLRILQKKWNETRAAGLIVNDGDPANIENWFFAVWAYNSGFYPEAQAHLHNGAWGVGWANNPVNPNYPANRQPFLAYTYDDARHPQDWPYPEKVMGFAAYPPSLPDGADTLVAGYRAAWWGGVSPGLNRLTVKPPVTLFCDGSNQCEPGAEVPPVYADEPAGPCLHMSTTQFYDLKCWYHEPAAWKTCWDDCGYELLRFDPGWEYQPDAVSYPPRCDRSGLPGNALVVDDTDAPSARPGCAHSADNGDFDLWFGGGPDGTYPSKVDFHQIGGGYGGHFWFGHTRPQGADNGMMKVTGTWTLDRSLNQWVRFLVHLPDHGAHTRLATYEIDLGGGQFTRKRTVQQRTQEHRWISLGALPVNGVPRIRLSTDAVDGTGREDVAWDAVAFEPLPGKPRHQIVALGDSYSSGEGASGDNGADYYRETDFKQVTFVNGDERRVEFQNLCHRSRYAWSRLAWLADDSRAIGERADTWDVDMDYHLRACTGGRTKNLLPNLSLLPGQARPTDAWGNEGQGGYGEPSQLDQGFLDEHTTLVTLSIGGNDAGFADVLGHCFFTAACADTTLDGDSAPLRTAGPTRIENQVKPSVRTVLTEIHRQAPNAKILLMGYPRLFEDVDSCLQATGADGPVGFDEEEIDWIREMVDFVATRLHQAVDEVRWANADLDITFANPISAWGGHGVCGASPALRDVVLTLTPGEQGPLPSWLPEGWNRFGRSQQSFHPTITGSYIFAGVMSNAITDAGWAL
ncbi:SGNH/GDSL hydrolase family protein [Phytohabitans suffuscus]|uniref:Uncharacterized protein n=1 Tax=Phytohabitans suffuscus TaxID=624315 RepID=A0A6F8YAE8_9ACTN|nr:SGNH/GDSL hydrolase family protein [Phytohabitans suffuscus]BCB83030.1 hypothetical protein Psuf_003430 [Phytohabitans suffuscus]